MFKHIRDARARRRGEELVESGFTLIELLVVIVVLGILAATVVFALTGVTGQSAQAACTSDAKTVEVAVQAYINSPDNPNNTAPANVAALVKAPFNNPNGNPDKFIAAAPTNSAYGVALNSELTTPLTGVDADAVVVSAPKLATTATGWVAYDTEAAGTGCLAAS
jgi:general secretion pathway protein G